MNAEMVSEGNRNIANDYMITKKRKNVIYAMLPIFDDVVILGDSLAESILDFRLLRKNNVVAKRGRTIDLIDDDMETAIHFNPRVLIMEYGKNDIQHFNGDVERFIKLYRRRINYARKALPQVAIYVNSLIPMHQRVMEKFGGMQAIKIFNAALYQMCEELNISFIDNLGLMKWDDDIFEYDGIHPKYPFYPIWLQHMAITAKLI